MLIRVIILLGPPLKKGELEKIPPFEKRGIGENPPLKKGDLGGLSAIVKS